MHLGQVHALFWMRKKGPKWLTSLKGNIPTPEGIDYCVNTHAKLRPSDFQMDASNLCNLLKSVRKRKGDVLAYMDEVGKAPGTLIRPERRAGYCKKWARRIRKERNLARQALRHEVGVSR